MKSHENYKELIWMLAKTDFKLRYQGSVLGYVWALLKPLLMFAVLNFVFSSIFNPRGTGADTYTLQLLTGLMMFYFFSEGTQAGMSSLMSKAQLVTKIYVPRWTIILASTISATLIFLTNLLVIVFFFAIKGVVPSFAAILMFLFFSISIYVMILSFSLIFAPLYVKFRDMAMIWEVGLMIILYGSPIIYPLSILPENIQRTILINPIAFAIHFSKEALISGRFVDLWKGGTFALTVLAAFAVGVAVYRKLAPGVAEEI